MILWSNGMLYNVNNILYFVYNYIIKMNRMGGLWYSRWYVYEEMKYILKICLYIIWYCLLLLEGMFIID